MLSDVLLPDIFMGVPVHPLMAPVAVRHAWKPETSKQVPRQSSAGTISWTKRRPIVEGEMMSINAMNDTIVAFEAFKACLGMGLCI
jgi:hypothetical protein